MFTIQHKKIKIKNLFILKQKKKKLYRRTLYQRYFIWICLNLETFIGLYSISLKKQYI